MADTARAKQQPLGKDALTRLQNTLHTHKEKFQQWQANVEVSGKVNGYGNKGRKDGKTAVNAPKERTPTRPRYEDPETEMRASMTQLIEYLEKSARDALPDKKLEAFSVPVPKTKESPLSRDTRGVECDSTTTRTDGLPYDPLVAAQIENELAVVCKEAEQLAAAVQSGPLHIPDGFLEDLDALLQQNSLLKDSQEKYVVENMRLRNEVTALKTHVERLQEEYNELHVAHAQKNRSFNYLQTLFDRQNVTHEKSAYIREISSLRAQNSEHVEKLAQVTKAYQLLQAESEHKLDQKAKEIALISKELAVQSNEPKQAASMERRDTDSIDELFSGSRNSSHDGLGLDLSG